MLTGIRKEKLALVIVDESMGKDAAKFMIEINMEQADNGRYYIHAKKKIGGRLES